MSKGFELTPSVLMGNSIVNLDSINDYTIRYGLSLKESELQEIVDTSHDILKSTGRIEIGGGVIDKLIKSFCSSSYIDESNFSDTIKQLIEMFYYFKNESMDRISDDELIDIMSECFENKCQGSLEYLQSTVLENLCRDARFDLYGDDKQPRGNDYE